jgi:hypothetical protein
VRGPSEIFYLFEGRLQVASLPQREFGKAMREDVCLQASTLTRPRQEVWVDVNANHNPIPRNDNMANLPRGQRFLKAIQALTYLVFDRRLASLIQIGKIAQQGKSI